MFSPVARNISFKVIYFISTAVSYKSYMLILMTHDNVIELFYIILPQDFRLLRRTEAAMILRALPRLEQEVVQ